MRLTSPRLQVRVVVRLKSKLDLNLNRKGVVMHYMHSPLHFPPTIVRSIVLGLNNVPPIFPHGFLGSLGAIYHRSDTNGWASLHFSSRYRKTAFLPFSLFSLFSFFFFFSPFDSLRARDAFFLFLALRFSSGSRLFFFSRPSILFGLEAFFSFSFSSFFFCFLFFCASFSSPAAREKAQNF